MYSITLRWMRTADGKKHTNSLMRSFGGLDPACSKDWPKEEHQDLAATRLAEDDQVVDVEAFLGELPQQRR